MSMNNKLELLSKITQYLSELRSEFPRAESLEWYLINNLERYLADIKQASSGKDIENASKALDRFCLESMDWSDARFKRCSELAGLGLKLSKSM